MTNTRDKPIFCSWFNAKVVTFFLGILFMVFGLVTALLALFFLHVLPPQKFVYDREVDYKISVLLSMNSLMFEAIGVFAVRGLLEKRAEFLVPMIIFLSLDFICTFLCTGGLLICWWKLKDFVALCSYMPEEWKERLLTADDGWLFMLVIQTLVLLLVLRAYLLAMVSSCYKFLTTQDARARCCDPEVNVVSSNVSNGEGSNCKPTTRDDIQKVPLIDKVSDTQSTTSCKMISDLNC